jgi:hypothetical protein
MTSTTDGFDGTHLLNLASAKLNGCCAPRRARERQTKPS